MRLKFDFSYCDSEVIGQRGANLSSIDLDAVKNVYERVKNQAGKGDMQWVNPIDEGEIARIAILGQKFKDADSFVVCGIGGSALGSLCCASALLSPVHNELKASKRNAPRFYVEDNIDGERLASLLDSIDIKNSYFNFVTKSGVTTETITQFLIIYRLLENKLGKKANERIIITTTKGKSELYSFALKNQIEVFNVPVGVGGRFSVFSAVGLIPLAAMGLDIKAFIKGAQYMGRLSFNPDINKNPALMAAYIMHEQLKSGKTMSVMMPYSSALKYTADFYCQLWGESLGKAYNERGELINAGQTPLRVLGTTDQHSQLQLFCEGPFDKVITFICVDNFKRDMKIPFGVLDGFDYILGKGANEVLNASQQATAYVLAKNGRSNFTIFLPFVCEYTLGQLLSYFMYQTAFMGAFMEVNAFDQPAVEGVKKAAAALMGQAENYYIIDEIKQFNWHKTIIE